MSFCIRVRPFAEAKELVRCHGGGHWLDAAQAANEQTISGEKSVVVHGGVSTVDAASGVGASCRSQPLLNLHQGAEA